MEQSTPKQKRALIASVVLLVLIVIVAIFWGGKSKTPTPPPPPSDFELPTAITSIEGTIKVISGGALYIEMDNPAEVLARSLTPKKIVLVALTTKNTKYSLWSDLPPTIDAEPVSNGSLKNLKQGDHVILTSAVNLVGIPEGGTFDVTRIEVIK